jgi:hypothetical protein
MKTFRERFSITKLVLLLIVLTLMFIEIWNVINWDDISDLFSNVVIAIISFYFWQKGMSYEEPDSIVERTDLDNNDNI